MNLTYIKKLFYILFGSMTLGLAILGIFLPILPTTPFLLVSAFFYLRSSKRLYHWLINHKVFGKYIHDYIKYKAIPVKTKISAIVILWLSMIISIIIVPHIYLKVMLTLIATVVTIYLLTLKTVPQQTAIEES
ncbi:YbaN family protein [Amphibacillus sp. Q70]|uniref:YbaN family protein n=1 Tax=Amphibacillus sp. Q70 TaxID=3453416 RepID=UPI003F84120F